MIRSIHFDASPIQPGTLRPLSVDADGQLEITLWCYRDPPGQVIACGRILLGSGKTVFVGPDIVHFPSDVKGEFRVCITDLSDSDERWIVVPVQNEEGTPNTNTSVLG